uniref:Uncharacterized protein n=1 Tax=Quercus lobata TaxID=97700 RepID=A0A7N2KZV4_QUELO
MKAGAIELDERKSFKPRVGLNRGVSNLDFFLSLVAILGTLGSQLMKRFLILLYSSFGSGLSIKIFKCVCMSYLPDFLTIEYFMSLCL